MRVNCEANLDRNDASGYINHKAPISSKGITVKEAGGHLNNSETREAKKIM